MELTIHTFPCDELTPISVFQAVAEEKQYAFIFESAEENGFSGRYSFIGYDPLDLLIFPTKGRINPFETLRKHLQDQAIPAIPDLAPLQYGYVGYLSYESVRHIESLHLPLDGAKIPESIFYIPAVLIIFDNHLHTLTCITHTEEEYEHVKKSIEELRYIYPKAQEKAKKDLEIFPKSENFRSNFLSAQEHIQAGNAFQIVISQRFEHDTDLTPFEIYRRLRRINPAPYLFYMHFPDFSIIGSSPETLVCMQRNTVTVRPIAGTHPRGKTEAEDVQHETELMSDPKERAEHMMLVDLGRNDLGRIAKPGTIEVKKCMYVQRCSQVMHLVSEIQGEKRDDVDMIDVLQATFPAGTLTGAPKIRAIEIIAELEGEPREIYGGAIGYFDLRGNMDFAIAIRTMLYQNGRIRMRTGAGIVADSRPAREFQECLHKARGPLSSLNAHHV